MYMYFSEKANSKFFLRHSIPKVSLKKNKIFLPTGVVEHFLMDGQTVKNNRLPLPLPML